jgi:hypothetical protein
MLSNNSHGGAMVGIGGSLGLSAMANSGQYCGIFRHTIWYPVQRNFGPPSTSLVKLYKLQNEIQYIIINITNISLKLDTLDNSTAET